MSISGRIKMIEQRLDALETFETQHEAVEAETTDRTHVLEAAYKALSIRVGSLEREDKQHEQERGRPMRSDHAHGWRFKCKICKQTITGRGTMPPATATKQTRHEDQSTLWRFEHGDFTCGACLLADDVKQHRDEAESAIMRLPKPPDEEGDGPDERVTYTLGLLGDDTLNIANLAAAWWEVRKRAGRGERPEMSPKEYEDKLIDAVRAWTDDAPEPVCRKMVHGFLASVKPLDEDEEGKWQRKAIALQAAMATHREDALTIKAQRDGLRSFAKAARLKLQGIVVGIEGMRKCAVNLTNLVPHQLREDALHLVGKIEGDKETVEQFLATWPEQPGERDEG